MSMCNEKKKKNATVNFMAVTVWLQSIEKIQEVDYPKMLRIGTPKTINFPFVSNGKLMFLGVPIYKHIIKRL